MRVLVIVVMYILSGLSMWEAVRSVNDEGEGERGLWLITASIVLAVLATTTLVFTLVTGSVE